METFPAHVWSPDGNPLYELINHHLSTLSPYLWLIRLPYLQLVAKSQASFCMLEIQPRFEVPVIKHGGFLAGKVRDGRFSSGGWQWGDRQAKYVHPGSVFILTSSTWAVSHRLGVCFNTNHVGKAIGSTIPKKHVVWVVLYKALTYCWFIIASNQLGLSSMKYGL